MSNEKPSYEQLFVAFSNKVEAVLLQVTVVLLLSAVIVQLLYLIPGLRLLLSQVAKLEGTVISSFATVAQL